MSGALHNFRLIGIVAIAVCVVSALNMSGCDAVRETHQRVVIALEDDRGQPVPNSHIRIKESWESWQSWEHAAEVDKPFYRARWESEFVPWIEAVTDADGRAVLRFSATALDSTKGNVPPAKRDWISNREYLITVRTEGGVEELRAVMKPGVVVGGKRHEVIIEAVDKPEYVSRVRKRSPDEIREK